jgi:hypothetical protein
VARISIVGSDLVVHLSALEKLGAVHGDVRIALSSISSCRVSHEPWTEVRGIRAPGTGIPGVIALGARRGGVHDFTAVYRKVPAVVVELTGAKFDRLVISQEDADEAAASINQALERTGHN